MKIALLAKTQIFWKKKALVEFWMPTHCGHFMHYAPPTHIKSTVLYN